jgi:hypothetical protein
VGHQKAAIAVSDGKRVCPKGAKIASKTLLYGIGCRKNAHQRHDAKADDKRGEPGA